MMPIFEAAIKWQWPEEKVATLQSDKKLAMLQEQSSHAIKAASSLHLSTTAKRRRLIVNRNMASKKKFGQG
jgi:hypothetical protein